MNEIKPTNLTAQLTHRSRGNPPSTTVESAIGNFFPGLEFDLRNIWTSIFDYLTLHEYSNTVLHVDGSAPIEFQGLAGATIRSVNNLSLFTPFTTWQGETVDETQIARDNALADLPALAGQNVVAEVSPVLRLTSVSSFLQQPGAEFPGELAVDREESLPWISEPQPAPRAEELVVDLGVEREVTEIRLLPGVAGTTNLSSTFPADFELAISSDAAAWQTVVQETGFEAEPRQWNRWPIDPTVTRYIRLNIAATRQLPETSSFLTAIGEIGVIANVTLRVREVFEKVNGQGTAVVAREFAEPGVLTQSLCSPWQNDFRDCGCFYWAASRPDFVNVEEGTSQGNNWMDSTRQTNQGTPVYADDDITHDRLFKDWEDPTVLRFVRGGRDSE